MLHEACHVKTLPNTKINPPKIGGDELFNDCIKEIVSTYNEYLAHNEMVNRFSQDRRFKFFKQNQIFLLDNFLEIVFGIMPNQWLVFQQISNSSRKRLMFLNSYLLFSIKIVYDALYFFVAQDNSFLDWFKRYELISLYTFNSWIFEDFECINNLNISSRVETDNKVISSGILNMHVNPIKLLDMGEIDFDEIARLFHKEKETWFKKRIDKDRDLIELWEKRVNSERKCPMCYLTKMRLMTTFNQFRNSHARY